MKCDVIVDMQYGSTGKGLVAGYMSNTNYYDAVVSANMPNAGHTAYDLAGRKFVHKVLPSGVFGGATIMIGPGAVFDPQRLETEVRALIEAGHLHEKEVLVHENATVLTQDMVAQEAASSVTKIASTAQGSMVATIKKMMRNPDYNPTAGASWIPPKDLPVTVVRHYSWMHMLRHARYVLAEGSQGYSLGLNQGFYPYCTSRDCTTARFLSEMAIPFNTVDRVIGVCRTFPIRVGNTTEGNSGGWYLDQKEITWKDIGVEPERTTVTNRVRRVATLSLMQLRDAVIECGITDVFLNFMNYIPTRDREPFIEKVQETVDPALVRWLGYGPEHTDIIGYRR
jgi:adenylosuccinate synthase